MLSFIMHTASGTIGKDKDMKPFLGVDLYLGCADSMFDQPGSKAFCWRAQQATVRRQGRNGQQRLQQQSLTAQLHIAQICIGSTGQPWLLWFDHPMVCTLAYTMSSSPEAHLHARAGADRQTLLRL